MGLYNPEQLEQEYQTSILRQGIPEPMSAPSEPADLNSTESIRLQELSAGKHNWVASLYRDGLPDFTKSDPNFNGYASVIGTKYEQYPEYFINTDNESDVEERKRQIDEKEEYDDLSGRAESTAFWSAIGWGVLDPFNIVPALPALKIAKVGKALLTTKAMTIGAGIFGGTIGAEEVILAGNNPERTITESVINTAAAAAVGAAFGGLVAHSAIRAQNKYALNQLNAESALQKSLAIHEDSIPGNVDEALPNLQGDDYISIQQRVSELEDGIEAPVISKTKVDLMNDPLEKDLEEALSVPLTSLDDIDNAQKMNASYQSYGVRVKGLPDSALKAIAIPHVINPSIEGLASPSGIVRDFTTAIGYTHVPLKNAKGEQVVNPFSLESAMQEDMLKSLDFNKAVDASYIKYLQTATNSDNKWSAITKSKFNSELASSKQFDEMTMDAMNAFDKHAIPEVQERAQYTRGLFDEGWKRMQEVGLIDKNQKPFPSYFKVVYDVPHIIKNRIAFEDALTKLFSNRKQVEVVYTNAKGDESIAKALYDTRDKSIDWEPRNGEKLKSIKLAESQSLDEIRAAAQDAVDNILQMGDRSLELGDIDRLSFTRNTDSMKPRKIVLNENDYQALKEFMIKDFRKLTQNYLAATSRAVNYKKLLDRYGWDDIQDGRIAIREEGKMRINAIRRLQEKPSPGNPKTWSKEKKEKMVQKVNKQTESSLKLFNDLAAISLGQFKKRTGADAFWRTLNQYNVARLYGGILISSLGDPASMLVKNWLPNAFWNGWVSEFKQLATMTRGLKTQDYRNALTAIQHEMDDLTRHILNPDMGVYGIGPKERFAQVAGNLQMKVSLMTTWNNFWQRASHNLAEHNLLKSIKKMNKKGVSYLKELGISESTAKRIDKMQKKYGRDVRGTHISNSHMWSDREAASLFNNAIRTEVHKSPLITEMLDIPRFFQKSEFRKSMVLGKGFTFGTLTKTSLSMAARHDAKSAQALIMLVLAGMAVQWLVDRLAGRESNYDIKDWIIKGFDRSAVLSMLGDPLFQGYRAYQGLDNYGSRAWVNEPLDYILGPSASIVNPVYRGIMNKLAGNDLDKRTQHQMHALWPYHKIWWYNLLGEE